MAIQQHKSEQPAQALRRCAEFAARKFGEYQTFLATAIRNPRVVGAPTPTSAAVAETVAQVVPTTGPPVVVELGPGTGSLATVSTAAAGRAGTSASSSAPTRRPPPRAQAWLEVVHGDAADLLALLDKAGVTEVDAVISSSPWSLLAPNAQDHILRQATEALTPHGAFTALTYLGADRTQGGRRFRARLHDTFDEVLTHTTWLNFPPILHYICRRPLR